MVAGVIGLIASLFIEFAYSGRRDLEVVREREPVVRERYR